MMRFFNWKEKEKIHNVPAVPRFLEHQKSLTRTAFSHDEERGILREIGSIA